jgi:hypothetical protein
LIKVAFKFHVNESRADALIVLLTEGCLSFEHFGRVLEIAVEKQKKVILIHDVTSPFPSQQDIDKLPNKVKKVFDSIPVPFVELYAKHCLTKILDKLFVKVC